MLQHREARLSRESWRHLHLHRADITGISLRAFDAALVGRQRLAVRVNALHCRNLVDGSAARAKRVRLGRSAIVGEITQLQVVGADVDLVGGSVEAAGVAGRFDVVAVGGPRSAAPAVEDRSNEGRLRLPDAEQPKSTISVERSGRAAKVVVCRCSSPKMRSS